VVSDLLDIAGPWHTDLLEPERLAIETMIADLPFRQAARPVFSTVTAAATRDADTLRWTVAASVVRTVEWHATVRAMRDSGIDAFVEVSPGRSIWGLLGQQPQPFGFSRQYQECVRGPARGTARINRGTGFSVPRQPLLAQVPA
jgi:malonyl CoA-acyl carrier protein transacylase